MNYIEQGENFATKTGTKKEILSVNYKKYFHTDTQMRYVFKILLTKDGKQYTFDFGQSIAAGKQEPTFYDLFTCFQKYDVGTFQDFCSEFGYNTGDFKEKYFAEKTYKAVCKEYEALCRLYSSEEIEEMQEIQ